MTRINLVEPSELSDNHLMAEYFELPRVFLLVHKHDIKGRSPEDLKIPDTYRVGTGHVAFFYDKLLWLSVRHILLKEEGERRGLTLQIDPNAAGIEHRAFRHTRFWGDYIPTEDAIRINRTRLAERTRYAGGSYPAN